MASREKENLLFQYKVFQANKAAAMHTSFTSIPRFFAGASTAGTATLIHLKIGIAEVVPTIELVDLRYAAGLSSISPGIKNFKIDPTFLDRKLSTNAMKLITTVLVVFRLFEDRQYIIPGPAAGAELRPVVVVAFLASHIDHGVNRTAATQALAAGIVDTAVVQTCIWLDFIAPVGAWVVDGKKYTAPI